MARRRLNKNVVLILTLVGAMALVGISVVMLRSLQATDPARFAQMAEAAEAEENWELAVLFYIKAFERSKDPKYLVKRGNAAMEWGELRLARESWRKAVIEDPSLLEARMSELDLQFELAKLYRDLQHWLNVEESVDSLLESGIEISPERLAYVHHARGLALVNLKSQDEENPRKGMAALKKAVTLDPSNVDYAISLARQYVSINETGEAASVLDSLIAKHTQPGESASKAHLAYGEFLVTTDRFDEAKKHFVKATELAAGDVEALQKARVNHATYISQVWSRRVRVEGRSEEANMILDEAKAILRRAIEAEPDSFEPYIQLAFIKERLLREHEETVALCEERLSREFSRKGIEAARNRFNVFMLNIWASEACVALAEDEADEKESWLSKAEQYLADARGEAPNHPLAYHQEGRIRLAQGRDRAALEAMRTADARYKAANRVDWELKTALASLHIRQDQPGAALELFEEVMPLAVTQRASDAIFWVLYAQALTETGEYRKAAAVLDPILLRRPNLAPALELKAAVLERMGQHKLAGEVVPSSSTSAILRAKESLLRDDVDGALKTLREAHAAEPGDFRLTGALVAQLMRQERRDEAVEVIAQAKAANPESSRIDALGVWVDPELSEEDRDARLLAIIDEEPDEFRRMLDLVDFHQSRNHPEEALVALNRAIDLAQEDSADASVSSSLRSLLRLKMNIGWRLKDDKVMTSARDLAVKFDVDGAEGKTFSGLLHMLKKDWSRAADMFRGALDIQGTDAESMAYLGECLLMMGRADDARNYMERAVRINPNLAAAHRGLARLAKLRGDQQALERHLAECERLIPSDPWVRAERFLLEERISPVEAIAKRERQYQQDPDDTANLRRLAALCATEGMQAKADRYYKELLDRSPDDRQLVMVVGSYYRQTDRADKALELVRGFYDRSSEPDRKAEAAVLLALHHVNTDNLEEAEATLLKASDEQITLNLARSLGEFYQQYAGRPKEAIEWYRKAVGIAEKDDPDVIPTLLENEIRCYLQRDLNDLEAASEKIAAMRSRYPDNPRALLLHSEWNARRGQVDDAINDLSEYLNTVPDDVVPRFLRAKHYIALGQVGAAIKDLETIRRRAPLALDLRPRLLLAGLHQQNDRADLWVRELESLVDDAPESTLAVGELVRAYIQQNRWADAERLITGRINDPSRNSQAIWYNFRGQISLELKQYERALADYRKSAELLDHRPAAVLDVASVYQMAQRPDEAISYLQRYIQPDDHTVQTLSRLGSLQVVAGRRDEAARTFRRAMRMATAGGDQPPGFVMASIRAVMEDSDAFGLFTDTSVSDELKLANDHLLASLTFINGKKEEGLSMVRSLVDRAGSDMERARLLQESAEMLADLKRYEEARQAYEESLALDQENWMLLNNLAFLLSDSMGEHAIARPYAEKAVELAETAFTLDTLGWILVGMKQYTPAIAELNQAVRLDPGSVESYYHLGEAYRRSGNFLRCRATMERAQTVATSQNNHAFDDMMKRSLALCEDQDATP